MEQVRRSLATAEARRKSLEHELAAAQQSGRAHDALRLRRNVEELSRSTEHLLAALQVIEARREAAHQVRQTWADGPAPALSPRSLAPDRSAQEVSTEQDADLEARKRRLSRARYDSDPPTPA